MNTETSGVLGWMTIPGKGKFLEKIFVENSKKNSHLYDCRTIFDILLIKNAKNPTKKHSSFPAQLDKHRPCTSRSIRPGSRRCCLAETNGFSYLWVTSHLITALSLQSVGLGADEGYVSRCHRQQRASDVGNVVHDLRPVRGIRSFKVF